MTVIEIVALVVVGIIGLLFLSSIFGKSRNKKADGEQGTGPYYGDGSNSPGGD